MGIPSDAAVPAGNTARQVDDIKSDVAQVRTARRGEATSIGARGMRFHSGGSATFKDGGGIVVSDGGDIGVEDGGKLYATYPSGVVGVMFGPLTKTTTGIPSGHGLLVQTDESQAQRDIFRAKIDLAGVRTVTVGSFTETGDVEGPVETFRSYALEQLHSSFGPDGYLIKSNGNGPIQVLSDGDLTMYADANCDIDAGGDIEHRADGHATLFGVGFSQVLSDGQVAMGGTSGTFILREDSGLAANVYMGTDGRIFRSTSSIRYKRDIQDLTVDPDAVLRLRPRSWLPRPASPRCPEWLHSQHEADAECPADQDPPEPDPAAERVVGFVAEELVEAGLADFVEFVDGQPESIRYDRLTAALMPLMQRQQTQLDALAEQVQALTDRLEAS